MVRPWQLDDFAAAAACVDAADGDVELRSNYCC